MKREDLHPPFFCSRGKATEKKRASKTGANEIVEGILRNPKLWRKTRTFQKRGGQNVRKP